MKNIKLLSVIAAASLFAACGGSQKNTVTDSTNVKTDTTTKMATTIDTTMNDTTFATKAALGGLTEVKLGDMASFKTQNTQVKEFADMMVMDHGKANKELMAIAKKKNITLPTAPDQMKVDSLGKLVSTEFDKAYVNAMVAGHQIKLDLMNKEAKYGKDADLKAFAAKTATTVQKHLDKITAIQSSMK